VRKSKDTLEIGGGGKRLVARSGRRSRSVALTPRTRGLLADSLRRGKVGLYWDGNKLTWAEGRAVAEVDGLVVTLDGEDARRLAERLDPPPDNPDEPYVRFRETNNWEMERWSLYIPVRGNEEAVRVLAAAARRLEPQGGCFIGSHLPYDIRMVPTPEIDVDRVCRRSRGGYRMAHEKLDGRLDLRKVRAAARRIHEDNCPLYKGGLADMVRPWGRGRPARADWPAGRYRASLRRLTARQLYERTAGRMMTATAQVGGFGLGGGRRMSYKERCWESVLRLEAAGLRTAGDLARLTRKELLAVPGVGRETAGHAEWMLRDAGLGLAER